MVVTQVSIQDFRNGINGVNTMAATLSMALKRDGLQVFHLTPYEGFRGLGLANFVRHQQKRLFSLLGINGNLILLMNALVFLSIAILFKRNRKTTWHAHDFISAWLIARLTGKPVVVSFHFSLFPWHEFTRAGLTGSHSFSSWLLKAMVVQVCRNPRIEKVFVSQQTYQLTSRLLKTRINSATVVLNGIEKESIKSFISGQRELINLVTAGRISAIKNPNFLVKTAKELKDRGVPFHLTFIGPAEPQEMEKLLVLISQSGLEKHITFTGPVNPAGIRKLLSTNDLYLHAATEEAFGLTVVEAMAARIPVIARYYPALEEILGNDHPGILHPAGTPAQMATLIESNMSGSVGRNQIIRDQYRRFINRFTAEVMMRNYQTIYKKQMEFM